MASGAGHNRRVVTIQAQPLDEPSGGAEQLSAPRAGIVKVSLALTYLAAATATWNGWKLGIGRIGDNFLVLALLAFLLSDAGRKLPRLPFWVKQFAFVILLVTVVHMVLPTSQAYLNQRLVVSGPQILRGGEVIPNSVVGLKFLLPIIGFPLLFAFAYAHDRRTLLRSAFAFAVGGSLSALIGFTDVLHLTALSQSITKIPALGNRAPGLTSHPNFLAMTCGLSIPIVLWLARSSRVRTRAVCTLFFFFLLLGLYASGSRSGAAVGAGTVLLCFAMMPEYRRLLPTISLLAAGSATLTFAIKPALGHALLQTLRLAGNTGSARGSDEARAIVDAQGMHDFLHSPIDGVGFQVAGEAHNVYLQALSIGGIILFTSYMIFLLTALVKGLRHCRFDSLAIPLFISALSGALFVIEQNAFIDRVTYVSIGLLATLPVGRAADPLYARPAPNAQAAEGLRA